MTDDEHARWELKFWIVWLVGCAVILGVIAYLDRRGI